MKEKATQLVAVDKCALLGHVIYVECKSTRPVIILLCNERKRAIERSHQSGVQLSREAHIHVHS